MRVPIRFAVLAGVVAIATLAIGACASTSRGADGERSTQATPRDVTVTVFYRERIMVPPNSELTVQVLDVTKSDSASTTVAESKTSISSAPPYVVRLEVPPELFIDSSRYEARASILRPDSTTMFRTAAGVPILTRGAADSVELMLRMDDGGR
ncbi:MAG TPA: YbaY family lipoprotein [Gemmatimonadales bacterium]|nr:YbaY family lipoprotein [Gemmatimonadales bacterium]